MAAESAPPSEAPVPVLRALSLGRAVAGIAVVSLAAFLFLVWLVFLKRAAGDASALIRALPAVNAGFNALSTAFLVCGYVQVRRRDYARHLRFMVAAFVSSTLFLVCYVIYHNAHGDTRFLAQGPIRPVYFFVLVSHIVLSAGALPLILTSFFLSLSGRFPLHRRVSRWTFPIWLYVSVTGVLVFALLKAFNPS